MGDSKKAQVTPCNFYDGAGGQEAVGSSPATRTKIRAVVFDSSDLFFSFFDSLNFTATSDD